MAEELMVVLKRSENSGFGFFLTTGPPHVIDNIIENSPASECGTLEVGDVILKVNETDVHRYTTKEVLKCLRLSNDLVTLRLKRDPKNKTYKKNKNIHYSDYESSNIYEIKSSRIPENPTIRKSNLNSPSSSAKLVVESPCRKSRIPTVKKLTPLKNAPQSPQHKRPKPSQIPKANGGGNVVSLHCNNQGQQNPPPIPITEPISAPPFTKARFEAYMMTGDVILNLSRTPQTSNLIPPHAKKVETVRDCPNRIAARANGALAPRASGESTPSSSSSPSHSESSESVNLIKKKEKTNIKKDHSNNTLSNNSSDRQHRKDSITNDTLLLCEEIDRDDDDDNNDETNYDNAELSHADCAHRIGEGIGDDLNDEFSACITSSSSSLHQNQNNFNRKDSYNITQQSSSAANIIADCSQENNYPSDSLITTTTTNRQINSSSSSTTVKSDEIISSPDETSFSVPVSPSLSTPLLDVKEIANSVPTSPEQSSVEVVVRRQHNGVVRKCDASGFRTSKSEDHLQQTQRDGIGAVIPIDIDEDVNSSLNTLLDTRQDSEDSQPTKKQRATVIPKIILRNKKTSNRDRIVWTYNAPVQPNQHHQQTTTSPNSHSSSISSSPQHSDSPASPTSVSSSVMSSSGSKGAISGMNAVPPNGTGFLQCPLNGDQSVSEAVSNISSPDYQDDDNLLSSRDMIGMALSDPSDSDSTILVSEAMQRKKEQLNEQQRNDHKLIIQVKGVENNIRVNPHYSELKDSEDEQATLTDDQPTVLTGYGHDTRESSPPVSDDGSDVDSLHSYHYSPKAVDMPSAIRLAKRLYSLDGFKKSDVSRHLSKNNDFSRAVADEYLKYFNFEAKTLDQSLREFLQQFALSGETQERERVLVHFSKRYLDCNPGSFNSQDAVHTLTCAIMLLNTDLHGQNIGRKMTCSEFVDNLAELNDGENFPKDILKNLYHAIKNHPLEWALDEELTEQQKQRSDNNSGNAQLGSNPFLDTSQSATAVEYKKGYVMRKSCYESNFKKTPFGKRSWKMFYCTLRDLVLYLHKDEHGFRKSQMSDNLHNAIRIHHALATKATDYTKKQHVFRLQTADQAEYLFQTSDSKELQSWIDTINFVCSAYSAPPLEGGVGSQKRFQRPLLPSSQTKLSMKEQLRAHEEQVQQLDNILSEHKRGPVPSKGLPLQNYKEKENYLQYELKRYKTYVYILDAKILSDEQLEMQNNLLNPDDPFAPTRGITGITNHPNNVLQSGQQSIPPLPTQQIASATATPGVTAAIPTNRYSYRTAIYRSEVQQDLG